MHPTLLSAEAYSALLDGAQLVMADSYGPKLWVLANGDFLKLFRVKRWWSSARWVPYGRRFMKHVAGLEAVSVPTVTVCAYYRMPHIKRTAVQYGPLAGQTLREYVAQQADSSEMARALGQFVAYLHEQGVYFRSLHFGNVIVTPEGKLGLIDVADMRWLKRPLSLGERTRNFGHMRRYEQDVAWLTQYEAAFKAGYASRPICLPRLGH